MIRAWVAFRAAAPVSSRCAPYRLVRCWPVATPAWVRNTQAGLEGPRGLGPNGVWLSSSARASCTRAACCARPGTIEVETSLKPPGAFATLSMVDVLPPDARGGKGRRQAGGWR